MVGEVNDTETRVIGLTPGVLYTISVSSENDVSSQDNNINDRSVSTTATTEEGGAHVSYIILKHTMGKKYLLCFLYTKGLRNHYHCHY